MDIVERWGRIFKRVNYGLDEEQVAAFVNELLAERDRLIQQQEYLAALIRFTERIVAEADNRYGQGLKEGKPKGQAPPLMEGRGAEAPTAAGEFQELARAVDQTKTGEPEPEWEVQILPPMDIIQALAIMSCLDSLPEVEKTELIPDINKPSIAIFVRKPIHLVEKLKTLSQVAEVKEDAASKAGGKPRKVQIVLSASSIPS
jgi:hypothetical protein